MVRYHKRRQHRGRTGGRKGKAVTVDVGGVLEVRVRERL